MAQDVTSLEILKKLDLLGTGRLLQHCYEHIKWPKEALILLSISSIHSYLMKFFLNNSELYPKFYQYKGLHSGKGTKFLLLVAC